MENKKTGYVWDKTTKEFCGVETVYLEKATNTYPHADNVTFIKPPMLEPNTTAVWNGDWVVVADYRGYPIYDYDGTFLGVVQTLDFKPQIYTPPPTRDDASHKHYEWINESWVEVVDQGFVEDGDVVRPMTFLERFEAGLEKELPENLIVKNGLLVGKTIDDRYNEGSITKEEYNAEIDKLREDAYKNNTDKIGLMYMRGEATKEEWLQAMEEIRLKYPKKQ